MEIRELSERVEKVSARYGEYLGIERDGDWFLLKVQEEVGGVDVDVQREIERKWLSHEES